MSNTKIGPITTLKDTLREVLVLIVQASKSATSCTEDEFIDKFITPVSYTHLTLPTKA